MHIEVRNTGMTITARERALMEDRLRVALSRFGDEIRGVVLRLRDLNGPRGGVDIDCHLAVSTYAGTTVIIDERAESIRAAIDVALDRATANLARVVQRNHDSRARSTVRALRARAAGDWR